jgi:methylated-DNA-[protein]-cysteine S-methyltransferase
MTTISHSSITTPVGELIASVDDGGTLVGLRYADIGEPSWAAADPKGSEPVRAQLGAYFAGALERFELQIRLEGSPFQRRVWSALAEIPYGTTVSYADVAAAIGRPAAARAVGGASRSNPVAIVIPCHRVIGASSRLTGYAGGLERKRALLELEGALPSEPRGPQP